MDYLLMIGKRKMKKPSRLSLSGKPRKNTKRKENPSSKEGKKGREQGNLASLVILKKGRKPKCVK
jgi:hypothetical protein